MSQNIVLAIRDPAGSVVVLHHFEMMNDHIETLVAEAITTFSKELS